MGDIAVESRSWVGGFGWFGGEVGWRACDVELGDGRGGWFRWINMPCWPQCGVGGCAVLTRWGSCRSRHRPILLAKLACLRRPRSFIVSIILS